MASNRREAAANYFVHDSYEVDTADNEVSFFSNFCFFLSRHLCKIQSTTGSYAFCGIMFNVEVLDDLPVDHVQINSIWVRGALGDMSIYTTPEGWEGKHERGKEWIKLCGT